MRTAPLVVALAFFSMSSAVAADPPAKRRVLVADAVANGVDATLAKTLTSMLVTRLSSRPGVEALSGAELRQLMSLQADKAACGSDTACANDLMGALGAPLAVFSEVGKLGALTEVNLTLFDVVKDEPVARAAVETDKLEELPAKLDKAVDELLGKAAVTPAAVASTPPTAAPATTPKVAAAPPPAAPAHAPATSSPPTPKAASASSLQASDVQKVVKSHRKELVECVQIAKRKKVNGTVTVRFLVAADGAVTWADVKETDLTGSGVPKCVIEKVGAWKFPATGTPTTISYPIVIKPLV